MIIKYVLDKSFGPPGSFTGYFILLVGLITVFASWSGLVLIVLGSFMAFSTSGCMIDCDNFKIRFTDNLWGIFKVGKWQYIHPRTQIGVNHARMMYRVSSISNHNIDVSDPDWRVYLYDGVDRRGKAICKFKNRVDAERELIRLSEALNIPIREEAPGTKQ